MAFIQPIRLGFICVVWAGAASGLLWADTPVSGPAWPGVAVDRQAGIVDLAATVVLRESQWVELLACTPGSREHESLLTVQAAPSHIHLALLTLGLEPGQPITTQQQGDQWIRQAPTGPAVEVTILVPRDAGLVQVPAGQWVRDRAQDATLEDARWMFTGSRFVTIQGQSTYAADLNGSVVSLVHFGDELIARRTDLTRDTDGQALIANTDAIPPVGTPVTLRLRKIATD